MSRYVAVLPKQFEGGDRREFDTEEQLVGYLNGSRFKRQYIVRDKMLGGRGNVNPFIPQTVKMKPEPPSFEALEGLAADFAPEEALANPRKNPDDDDEAAAKAASWQGPIVWGDITFNAGLWKLVKKSLLGRQRIYTKDIATGKLVADKLIDAVSRQKAVTVHAWLDEEGREVPRTQVATYTIEDGKEIQVERFPKSDAVRIMTELTPEQHAQMLNVETYELIPHSEEDTFGLTQMHAKMTQSGKYPAGEIVFRIGWNKQGVVFMPYTKENGEIAVLATTVSHKVTPTRTYKPMTARPAPKAPKPAGKTLKVKSPFGNPYWKRRK